VKFESIAFKNLSCCCPPRPNPSIPDHNTWQGMPWEQTEGLLTLRWWPKSLFPVFPEMHHFCPANKPTHGPIGANFHPPFFCFDGYGLTLNPKPIWEQRNWWNSDQNPHFYTHVTFLTGKWHNSSPPHTLDPKLINFYAEVLHLCIETIGWPQMGNSGKRHQFPLFGWGMAVLTHGDSLMRCSSSLIGNKQFSEICLYAVSLHWY
jgi:hypothetical protein